MSGGLQFSTCLLQRYRMSWPTEQKNKTKFPPFAVELNIKTNPSLCWNSQSTSSLLSIIASGATLSFINLFLPLALSVFLFFWLPSVLGDSYVLTSASLRLTRSDSQSFLSSNPLLSPSLLHPSYHPFIPSISAPPLSVIPMSVIALCLEVRSEALITTDDCV